MFSYNEIKNMFLSLIIEGDEENESDLGTDFIINNWHSLPTRYQVIYLGICNSYGYKWDKIHKIGIYSTKRELHYYENWTTIKRTFFRTKNFEGLYYSFYKTNLNKLKIYYTFKKSLQHEKDMV